MPIKGALPQYDRVIKLVKIKEEALAHYDRMIKWAKKQKLGTLVSSRIMRDEINESWMGKDCPYCLYYNDNCTQCLLSSYGDGCCCSLWGSMDSSVSWSEWVFRAKKVRAYIQANG